MIRVIVKHTVSCKEKQLLQEYVERFNGSQTETLNCFIRPGILH